MSDQEFKDTLTKIGAVLLGLQILAVVLVIWLPHSIVIWKVFYSVLFLFSLSMFLSYIVRVKIKMDETK
jgi:hypothetical protein